VVQKGDSPAGIAKKFKVSYAELLKTNNIEDPKKLQIGQRLLIP
jgi:LysM repeat protein